MTAATTIVQAAFRGYIVRRSLREANENANQAKRAIRTAEVMRRTLEPQQ